MYMLTAISSSLEGVTLTYHDVLGGGWWLYDQLSRVRMKNTRRTCP